MYVHTARTALNEYMSIDTVSGGFDQIWQMPNRSQSPLSGRSISIVLPCGGLFTVCYHLSPIMRKPGLCICENNGADQLCTAQLICDIVFAPYIVQSLVCLHLRFHASSHLLWLYSPVYVKPGGRQFSRDAAHFRQKEKASSIPIRFS